MNLPDNYYPSQPIDDRRGETYYGRERPQFSIRGNPVSPRSLLDMLPRQAVMQSYAAPAGGLAEQLGYNQMGRQPMPRGGYQDPLASSPAAQSLYRSRMMGGTGGRVPYVGDQFDY